MSALDLDFIRRQFPAFSEPSLADTAFFENAGGSYMCAPVMERLITYFRRLKLQPYHPNPIAREAGDWMNESAPALAPWMNVKPEEVYFGPSTSQNTYVLADAVMGWLKPGDAIIVCEQDHEANGGVWRRLADRGIEVKEWRVKRNTGALDLDALPSLLTESVKLLTFPHCSNILGQVNPVASICALAAQYGVRTVVDGVSFAGHGLPDVAALGCDIYLYSLYKVYGPHQGVMVIRDDMAPLLESRAHFFNAEVREKRLNPAGPDHAQVAACKGVADYFDAVANHHFGPASELDFPERAQKVRDLLHDAEVTVLTPLMAYLRDHPQITILGPDTAEGRAPTISVTVDGHVPAELADRLGEAGILCGAGHFYSYRLIEALGIDPSQGVLRFSFVHYTSPEDVQRLITELERLLAD